MTPQLFYCNAFEDRETGNIKISGIVRKSIILSEVSNELNRNCVYLQRRQISAYIYFYSIEFEVLISKSEALMHVPK